MGWLSAALYLSAAGVGAIYLELINHDDADRATLWTFILPTWTAVGLLALTIGLFVVGTVLAAIAVRRARKEGEPEPAADVSGFDAAPAPASPPPAAAPRGARMSVGRGLWDDYAGLRAERRVDSRRKVKWSANGMHVGWLDPTITGGWSVSDLNGNHVGEAPNLESALTLLRRHLLGVDA